MRSARVNRCALSVLALPVFIASSSPIHAQSPVAPDAAGHVSDLPTVPPLAFRTRQLGNGLTVYSMRDVSTPNVLVSAWYEVGAKNDPDGLTGFAHLFEHLLSRKTVNMSYNQINRIVEEVGGTRNAGTAYDYTIYHETVPARYLETILWTHAERLGRPVLDQEVLDSERGAIIQEIRETIFANPYGHPGRLTRIVIPDHSLDAAPHRRGIAGDTTQLATATLQDVLAFQEAHYGPESVFLIVTGNFDEASLDAAIDRHFSHLPRRTNPAPRLTIREPPRTSPRLVYAFAPNLPFPAIVSSWKLPSGSHPDLAAIAVLNAILTRGDNSRLRNALVDQGLLTQVNPQLSENAEVGYYAIWGILSAGKRVEDAESVLEREIERVRNELVSAAELSEARNELITRALQQRETLLGRTNELGEGIIRTGDPAAADKRVAAIREVSAADVQRVARTYLDLQARVAIRYLDETERERMQDSGSAPIPIPVFERLPAAVTTPRRMAEEGERQAPPPPSEPVEVRRVVPAELRLPSRLAIITAKTGEIPLATIGLVIRGGTSSDPAGKAGLSALVADIARRGTRTRSAQQIASALEALGATMSTNLDFSMRDALSASSGLASIADGIVLSVTAPVANLEAAGGILADIAQNAALSGDEFERSRARALANLAIVRGMPSAIATLVLHRAIYGSAPYGRGATSSERSLRAITHADVETHYRRWWHPANAAVVIAGGIERDQAAALARTLFSSWRGDTTPPDLPAERAGALRRGRTIVIDMPAAPQAAVVVGAPTVGRGHRDFHDLAVANVILGVGATSRLFEEVRSRRALSYGPGSWFSPRADASLVVAAAPTRSETVPQTLGVLLAELDRLGGEPLAADYLDRRKAFTAGVHTLLTETSAAFASALASLVQQGVPASEATRYSERVASTDVLSVRKAASEYLRSDSATVVIVGDAATFLDALRPLRADIELLKLQELDLDLLEAATSTPPNGLRSPR